ncbi:hypothetical protein QFC21_000623 [Naganishia friedmannii]|uniref:Uncharacterized protein n=1 Tax=Naganishia friedmannii TaxID=89922 RepID=A0ACC2WDJ3_9TREE|nr:hypothetical protein QFC21_000623 [Naganishia friedmannii]
MSVPPIRLSAPLKSILAANPAEAPSPSREQLETLFDAIRIQSEEQHAHTSSDNGSNSDRVGERDTRGKGAPGIWLIVLTASLFALNALKAIPHLYAYAVRQHAPVRSTHPSSGVTGKEAEETEDESEVAAVWVASRMREVGLKSASFMGVPRVRLPLPPVRVFVKSEYPHNEKLLTKLGDLHADLPTHILQSHYSSLLAPVALQDLLPADLDRVEMSVLAVACLRALGGVGKQVESHVFGLRKAREEQEEGKGGWITSEEGCLWLLCAVDRVAELFRGAM